MWPCKRPPSARHLTVPLRDAHCAARGATSVTPRKVKRCRPCSPLYAVPPMRAATAASKCGSAMVRRTGERCLNFCGAKVAAAAAWGGAAAVGAPVAVRVVLRGGSIASSAAVAAARQRRRWGQRVRCRSRQRRCSRSALRGGGRAPRTAPPAWSAAAASGCSSARGRGCGGQQQRRAILRGCWGAPAGRRPGVLKERVGSSGGGGEQRGRRAAAAVRRGSAAEVDGSEFGNVTYPWWGY